MYGWMDMHRVQRAANPNYFVERVVMAKYKTVSLVIFYCGVHSPWTCFDDSDSCAHPIIPCNAWIGSLWPARGVCAHSGQLSAAVCTKTTICVEQTIATTSHTFQRDSLTRQDSYCHRGCVHDEVLWRVVARSVAPVRVQRWG